MPTSSKTPRRFASAGASAAVITAAAGLAYKHRDKLTALLKRNGDRDTGVSALPPGTPEAAPRPAPAAEANTWTSDPAQTAATPDTALGGIAGSGSPDPPADPTGTQPPTVAPEAAEEPSPWVSPQPPAEESPWVSPQPPNEEQAASPPDPRTQEPPGEER